MSRNDIDKLLGGKYARTVMELILRELGKSQVAYMVSCEKYHVENGLKKYLESGDVYVEGGKFYLNYSKIYGRVTDGTCEVIGSVVKDLSGKIKYHKALGEIFSLLYSTGKEGQNGQE